MLAKVNKARITVFPLSRKWCIVWNKTFFVVQPTVISCSGASNQNIFFESLIFLLSGFHVLNHRSSWSHNCHCGVVRIGCHANLCPSAVGFDSRIGCAVSGNLASFSNATILCFLSSSMATRLDVFGGTSGVINQLFFFTSSSVRFLRVCCRKYRHVLSNT